MSHEGAGDPDEAEEEVTCQTRIKDLLDRPESSFEAQVIQYVLIFFILLSTVAAIVETMPEMRDNPIFFPLEVFITTFFTIEYALRLSACDSLWSFSLDPYNIVDFFAIFPGYADIVIMLVLVNSSNMGQAAHSMRTLRMIRLIRLVRVTRIMRVVKVARYSKIIGIMCAVFLRVAQSGLLVIVTLVVFAMVLSSSLMYVFESDYCEKTGLYCTGPAAFTSIPAGFWWAISTLTTVGYGDMVPHTPAGQVIGGLTSIIGVIIIAVCVALVSINFRECYLEEKARADIDKQRAAPVKAPELDAMVASFDDRAGALIAKLKEIGERQDSGRNVAPVLEVLASHVRAFSNDARVVVEEAKAKSARR